ncbi:MAG: response regulator transcription factor [Candidatus Omnitrophica bacterium]|nr:response regulator transcription factor [Candidatus Omnitrophota bacterium]
MANTILITDDHDIIRKGLKSVLEQKAEYKVVGEAEDGEEALEKIEKLKPDILLLDVSMPKISGLDIIAQARRRCGHTKIIVITVHKTSAFILKAFKSGASGYLIKENAAEELLPALGRVLSGGTYLSALASADMVGEMVTSGQADKFLKKEKLLTSSEYDILRLAAEGKSAKEIAKTLFISPRTAENRKNIIMKKLNLHKTSELIKYALEHKLLDSNI